VVKSITHPETFPAKDKSEVLTADLRGLTRINQDCFDKPIKVDFRRSAASA
jgi:hypothetical protein